MDNTMIVESLKCESLQDPIGLYTMKPRFSWLIKTDMPNTMQESYRIEVVDCNGEVVWDSGETHSDRSVLVDYAGTPLAYRTRYKWRVRVVCNGVESDWSEFVCFETVLECWTADFISADDAPETSECKIFYRKINIEKPLKAARIYATALGLYELHLNHRPVSDSCFDPGWTAYNSRVLYRTYDVTDMLKQGENELTAHIAAGWYKGDLTCFEGARNLYGGRMAFSAEISVIYDDDSFEVIKTDGLWLCSDSPVLYAEIYHGETYDACRESVCDWKPATIHERKNFTVEPFDGVPVRKQEILKPVDFFTTPKGERLLDFGQNLVGRIRFSVNANEGDRVVLRHAEVLDKNGNFYTDNLRTAKCMDTYICKGGGEETYEPHFTFHGFRYVCVDDFPGEIDPGCFEAVVLHSDMDPTGTFSCSDPLIDQLQSNIKWGMKGNFLDIPTDCNQRDERLGWTGDAQVFIHTACYLYNVLPFFRKWLRDLALDQKEDGSVPFIAPDIFRYVKEMPNSYSACGWGDAAVIIPWVIYETFGDQRILEEQYDCMKKWVNHVRSQAIGNLWNTGFHFGDWVALDAKEGESIGATPTDLCATAYYAYSTELLGKTAEVLGKTDDADEYRKLHSDIVKAYQKEFFTPNGRLAAHTQTAHILSLIFGLTPEVFIPRTVDTLVKLIKENKEHMVTGFLGTPYFCHALSSNGKLDDAYKLLQREEYPSWLYQVTMGATTIWEHLDSLKPDGTMWSADMNSFNHYAYGAVGDWLYKVVAGINPIEPGYKRIRIAPHIGGTLTHAEGRLQTPYGEVVSRWERDDCNISITVKIPPNTSAEVFLPNGECASVGSGEHTYTVTVHT